MNFYESYAELYEDAYEFLRHPTIELNLPENDDVVCSYVYSNNSICKMLSSNDPYESAGWAEEWHASKGPDCAMVSAQVSGLAVDDVCLSQAGAGMQHGRVVFPWGIGDFRSETCTRAGNYLVHA